ALPDRPYEPGAQETVHRLDRADLAGRGHAKNSSRTGARAFGLTPCVWRASVRSCALGIASLIARAASRMGGDPLPPCMTRVGVLTRARSADGRACPSPSTSLSYLSVGASFSSPFHIGIFRIASTCLSETPTDRTNSATASPSCPAESAFLR